MRKVVFSLLAITIVTFTFAQSCIPDSSYFANGPGLYPLPDTTMGQDSTLGINKMAYEGCMFDFTFTFLTPDSIEIPNVGWDSVISIELKNVSFKDTAGNVVTTGVESFSCDLVDCLWPGDTIGCINIFGTVSASPGQYQTILTAELITEDLPFPINLELPSPTFNPGEYILNVEPASPTACPVAVTDITQNFNVLKASPNPFNRTTTVSFESERNLETTFRVFTILGQLMYSEEIQVLIGENKFEFDGSHLSTGIYFYSIGNGKNLITEKFIKG